MQLTILVLLAAVLLLLNLLHLLLFSTQFPFLSLSGCEESFNKTAKRGATNRSSKPRLSVDGCVGCQSKAGNPDHQSGQLADERLSLLALNNAYFNPNAMCGLCLRHLQNPVRAIINNLIVGSKFRGVW